MSDQEGPGAMMGRRSFLWAGALAAAAPILTEANFAAAATAAAGPPQRGGLREAAPPGAVMINANENPLGPSKAAIDAIVAIAPLGGRYDLNGDVLKLTNIFASQHGLKDSYVAVYAGSSEPLHYSVMAFTSPTNPLVTADPSYEAAVQAAVARGAPVKRVPLTADYAHDVKALVAADPNAGVIYICNPNNPTGTITSRQDILWALENKPKGSILLVDEAYIHLSDAEDVIDQVAADKDIIILRTFSKIYGMAGIRCGFALGRPDLLAKLKTYGSNAMPITGVVAAQASLLDPDLVPARKAKIAATRNDTLAWLAANGYKVVGKPETNCFMIDTGVDGRAVFNAMKAKNVYIGRVWPVWPKAVRVSVGTPEEMAKFKVAFKAVMDAKATLAAGGPAPEYAGPSHFPYLS